jgi:methylmalonyl-CoA/ethylmalonyl-CoA epimerase
MSHGTAIRVDHAGIAVESIEDAEPVLFALGGQKRIEESVEGRFRWAQYDFGQGASRLELVAPERDGTFLTDFLEENGPGLHHVTLEVADVDAVVAALDVAGIQTVDYREFEDWTEVFVSPANATGTLFQLMEYHDSYETGRPPAEHLYVDGHRLGADEG